MKTIKICTVFLVFYFLVSQVNAANINNVEVINMNNIDITLDTDSPIPQGKMNADIQILQDIEVSSVTKDLLDQSKITLNLTRELGNQKTYSILSILGPESSIDFTFDASRENGEVYNNISGEEQGVTKLVVKDPKTLELFYNMPVGEMELEFKLLSEFGVVDVVGKESSIGVSLASDLEDYSNYMLVLLSISSENGGSIILEDSLFNFQTAEVFVAEEDTVYQSEEELFVPPVVVSENQGGERGSVGDVIPSIDPQDEIGVGLENQGNLEEISLNAATTPDTGAETWVLLILTFLVTTGIFGRAKIIKL